MNTTPDIKEQILQSHSGLIHRVVLHCKAPGSIPDLEVILTQAEENEWIQLVAVIRKIMSGDRETSLLGGLDGDDLIIIDSILKGIQNPETLPNLTADFNSSMAAPGLASLLHESRKGNTDALTLISNMAKQMLQSGGDMAILSGRFRPLIEGERDLDKLCENMSEKGEILMKDIVTEITMLENKSSLLPAGEGQDEGT